MADPAGYLQSQTSAMWAIKTTCTKTLHHLHLRYLKKMCAQTPPKKKSPQGLGPLTPLQHLHRGLCRLPLRPSHAAREASRHVPQAITEPGAVPIPVDWGMAQNQGLVELVHLTGKENGC